MKSPPALVYSILLAASAHASLWAKPVRSNSEPPPPAATEPAVAPPNKGLLTKLNPFAHREPSPQAKTVPQPAQSAASPQDQAKPAPRRSLFSKLNPFSKPPSENPKPEATSTKTNEKKPPAISTKKSAKLAAPDAHQLATPSAPPKEKWLTRLNPFSKKSKDAAPPNLIAKQENKQDARPKRSKLEVKETEPSSEEKRPGLLARFFGGASRGAAEPKWSAEKPVRPADWQKKWVVTVDTAETYSFGPAQASGSDGDLLKGTIIELRRKGRGWSDIKTDDGKVVCIASDEIRPARKDDFADPPPPTTMAVDYGPMPFYDPLPAPNLPDGTQGADPLGAGLLPTLPTVEPQ